MAVVYVKHLHWVLYAIFLYHLAPLQARDRSRLPPVQASTGEFRQYRPSIDLLHQVRPQGALGLPVQASTGQYGPAGASTARTCT